MSNENKTSNGMTSRLAISSNPLQKLNLMYWSAIRTQAGGNFGPNGDYFVPIGQYTNVNFGTTQSQSTIAPPQSLGNSEIYHWANAVLGRTAPSDTAAPFSAQTLGPLDSALSRYLYGVDLGGSQSGPNWQNYQDASDALSKCAATFDKAKANASTLYAADPMVVKGVPSLVDWLTAGNDSEYTSAKSAVDAAYANFTKWQTVVYGDGVSLLQQQQQTITLATGLTSNSMNMPCSTSAAPDAVTYKPTYSIGGDYVNTAKGWLHTYSDVPTNKINTQGAFHQVLSVSSSFTDDWSSFGLDQSSYGGSASWGNCLFSVEGSGGHWEKTVTTGLSIDNSDESFTVTINYQGFATFDITPGSWFIPNVTKLYPNMLDTIPANDQKNLRDILSATPATIVMGYAPMITMTMNQNSFKSLTTTFDKEVKNGGGGGFCIFGIRIGGGGDSESHESFNTYKSTQTSTGGIITIGPIQQTSPQLLGIIYRKNASVSPSLRNALESHVTSFAATLPNNYKTLLRNSASDYTKAVASNNTHGQKAALSLITAVGPQIKKAIASSAKHDEKESKMAVDLKAATSLRNSIHNIISEYPRGTKFGNARLKDPKYDSTLAEITSAITRKLFSLLGVNTRLKIEDDHQLQVAIENLLLTSM